MSDLCRCGHPHAKHAHKPPHPCIHDITAWHPDPVLVGYQATSWHCERYETA